MNNATTTSPSLSISSSSPFKLQNKLQNKSLDDFLIINLPDSFNLDKQDALLLSNHLEQNTNYGFNNTRLLNDQINASQFNVDLSYLYDNFTNNLTINLNETSLIDQAPTIEIHHPLLALFLACICIFIVFGNLLIIVAVKKSRQLRQQTTNYFVISLAFSDALVGLIVMPFSVVQEVLDKVWPFGPWMCDIWHSFDVLGTTSSILSLCVISIDRYYAITKPFDYAVKMTSKKAKLLIILIFIVSSLLSFPAIFWWRSVSVYKPYTCSFPVSTGYIVFSSTLSFYGPLVVMVVSYWKIYRAAVEQTRSLKTGAKTISYTSNIYHASGGNLGHFDNGQFTTGKSSSGDYIHPDQITLRMHRGGNYNDSISSKLNSNLKIENNKGKNLKSKKSPFSLASSKNRSSASLDRLASVFCNLRNEQAQQEENVTCGSKVDLTSNNETNKTNKIDSEEKKQDSFESQVITSGSKNQVNNAWSISRKVSKLAKERKAAKTLGIVMGVFILMWAPFFITHIVMGICAQNCDINEDLVYSIVTWLGWLNSGCNPIIYALWSRDFRRAFRKVLCGFRDSNQRSSTGYSSYYFSSKFNAPASLARKRPLIGDRQLNRTAINNNKLTSIKQSNLTSNNQSKMIRLDKQNSKMISTINELDDNCETSVFKSSLKNDESESMKSNKNVKQPSESKSSPNLMCLSSSVIKESDLTDNLKADRLTNTPLEINKLSNNEKEQSNLMCVAEKRPLMKKQRESSSKEQLDGINNENASQMSSLNTNVSRTDNNQSCNNLKENEDVKKIIEHDAALKSEQLNRKGNKLDRRRSNELRNRFSIGDWFRSSSKENSKDRKDIKKQKNNSNKIRKSSKQENDEYNNGHVDRMKQTSSEKVLDRNNKESYLDRNERIAIQADNSSVAKIEDVDERIIKHEENNFKSNNEPNNNNTADAHYLNRIQMIAHNQDQLINNKEATKKNGRTGTYFKITAESAKPSNEDSKLSDNLTNEKDDLDEEFLIKIQLEPR